MKILALETAVQPGSIALLENAQLLAHVDLAHGSRTTRSLLPAIQSQLSELGWRPADVALVAVSRGPGSFTGLRVGITVAKTLAYAVGAQVLGIDTLDVIARQVPPVAGGPRPPALWAVMDAQRKQLFCAKYACQEPAGWQLAQPPRVVDITAWLETVSEGDVVAGPPVEKLRSRIQANANVIPAVAGTPRAAVVGALAEEAFRQGRRDDLWALVPKYHRLSAAEEKRAAKPG